MKTHTCPVRCEDDILMVYAWSTGASIKLRATSTQLEETVDNSNPVPAAEPATAATHVVAGNRITVLLADDHRMVRQGFRRMLELEGDFAVVGEAQNGRQAVFKARELCPDVVLMDIAMPQLNGLEASRRVIKERPDAKVLILSAHRDDAYIQGAVEAGAVGFLLKQTSSNVVCRAIRDVRMGKKFFCPSVSRRLNYLNGRSPDRAGLLQKKIAMLSSRSLKVLRLLAEGCDNQRIAEDLSLQVNTVEKHRETLMEELEVRDTAGLTRCAISAGLIDDRVHVAIVQDSEE